MTSSLEETEVPEIDQLIGSHKAAGLLLLMFFLKSYLVFTGSVVRFGSVRFRLQTCCQ